MAETLDFRDPADAGWFLRHLRDKAIYYDDSCILENLFSAERISQCDESVFLEAGDYAVVALGIISKKKPAIWSYYTVPEHRRKGYGYTLLEGAIRRIVATGTDQLIEIEPTSEGSKSHIARLPEDLKCKLRIVRGE
jgi:GNAT superfamily N-acetyltransferase